MATLKVNETRTTTTGFLTIDAGLPPGRYRYQLVVQDDQGNRSAPVQIVVIIRPTTRGPR
ncbi:MAG: hypothetical protein SGI92_05295 [Bryobacteraceae bacterium]|nr:hypothetical protein [Bryobacteraceae bacterium]